MHSKNHRVNHDFQIIYQLVGKCHTVDAAYALLMDLKEDRETALSMVKSSEYKAKAEMIRIERMLASEDEAEVYEGKAKLAEIEATRKMSEANILAAQDELNTITDCIEKINPFRKYKDLPDAEAFEAGVQEEWKHEYISRAKNQLICTGTISPEDFSYMHLHPAFKDEILPVINEVSTLIRLPGGREKLMSMLADNSAVTPQSLILIEDKSK